MRPSFSSDHGSGELMAVASGGTTGGSRNAYGDLVMDQVCPEPRQGYPRVDGAPMVNLLVGFW